MTETWLLDKSVVSKMEIILKIFLSCWMEIVHLPSDKKIFHSNSHSHLHFPVSFFSQTQTSPAEAEGGGGNIIIFTMEVRGQKLASDKQKSVFDIFIRWNSIQFVEKWLMESKMIWPKGRKMTLLMGCKMTKLMRWKTMVYEPKQPFQILKSHLYLH